MEPEKLLKIEESIKRLSNRQSRIYFLVQDTKGNGKGSIRYTYQIAMTLKEHGFNPVIMHEAKEYTGVGEWLGEEYMELPHQAIEGQNLEITPDDFIIIPELYGHVLEQISNFPCGKIILCQSYDYMLETMAPGVNWAQYGFRKGITTNKTQEEYIKTVMKSTDLDVLEPLIPTIFSEKTKPSKPIVSILCREPRNTAKIIKTFYLKYPQFRWITFRDMKNITQQQYSEYLKDSFVSVWVDDESGFGTFPLESMASRTPVIGKVPNMKPEWMTDYNGVWTYEINNIVDILAEFIQNWLEDNISDSLYENSLETVKKYQNENLFNSNVLNLFNEYFDMRKDSFQEQLNKTKVTEEI